MLGKTRSDMLSARKTLGDSAEDKKQKKYIDYTLRQYAKKQLNSIADLLSVLEAIPEEQLKKIVTPEHAKKAMQVVEKLVELLEPASIEIKDDKPHIVHRINIVGKVFDLPENAESIVKITFPARPEEVELSTYVAIHADIMRQRLQELPMKKVTIKDYNRKLFPQLAKTALERGQLCQIELENATAWIEDQPEN